MKKTPPQKALDRWTAVAPLVFYRASQQSPHHLVGLSRIPGPRDALCDFRVQPTSLSEWLKTAEVNSHWPPADTSFARQGAGAEVAMVRFKHRYLLCEVVSDDPRCRLSLDDRVLGGLVRDTVARLHGTFGAAACSIGFAGICSYSVMCPKCHCFEQLLALDRLSYPKTFDLLLRIQFPKDFFPAVVRYLNAYTGIVLLRCRKEFYQLVWSALPFITHLENKGHRYPCFLNTLHVGGTIRTCQKFLIQYNRRQLLILLQNCTDEGEREAIQKSVTRSCLLEEEPGEEELSDGEEAAEAME
ncbi:Ribonuclease P/MRP protein subunit POP5 [Myotis brandtii]|uniref:Ribonuclease P/MRP protein subunit POP5 n=1 Tax=Myotis brandtii TaxID=109478 RepID=S7MPK3_MYOBR|nr:Ribonuclease P/MRP protein subunit POP5 [Myotis brandtii]